MYKTRMKKEMQAYLKQNYGTTLKKCDDKQAFYALMDFAKKLSHEKENIAGDKKVYYISAEFLIGKLLSNNLLNLGAYDEAREVLAEAGKNIVDIEEVELEPSLGNGGLGRLAACFLDSIASLGLDGDGIGLNYHFGLFKQVFENKLQHTTKNEWIEAQSWLTKTDVTYDVNFGDKKVVSRMYDIDVVGYNQGTNKLHLFDVESIDESIVEHGINFDKTDIEKNLTLFLYPDDSDENGHLLRIYQQYFMVSNAARLVLQEVQAKGFSIENLDKHAVIQINDTHPTLVIPELIRILTEEYGFDFGKAVDIVSKTCAYTNHTILAEALEKWPVHYLEKVVPQLVPIIRKLDAIIRDKFTSDSVQVIDGYDRVHMAHICIHFGFSVNGVAALHTEILKASELSEFYAIYPEKFNNKTNGITFRRWLLACNKELTEFIESLIGDGFKTDALELEKLMDFIEKPEVLERLIEIKTAKKKELAEYIEEKEHIVINENSIFDIQIKRLHEYKRQQMNALYIIHKYLEIKEGKLPEKPVTFIFGAKAAPAYVIAQDIIHLLLVLQEIVNNDPDTKDHMTVVMVENYNVTYAEKLIPACDISEQISLASKEASGTGNMKFMLNGAVTLGTQDGANVEIHELVGDENIYTFGKHSDEVMELYKNGSYCSKDYYENSAIIKRAVDFIVSEQVLAHGHFDHLNRLYHEFLNKDWFMTLLDLEEYIAVKDKMIADCSDKATWDKKMLVNIAKAGFFSADRTIEQYNTDIWKLK
ncbi:MAG: glycogen/starch/alpha-glucan phosphorylase [Clostridia bacterium]